jgi:hypothetical protein
MRPQKLDITGEIPILSYDYPPKKKRRRRYRRRVPNI